MLGWDVAALAWQQVTEVPRVPSSLGELAAGGSWDVTPHSPPLGKLIPFPVHSPLWELLVSMSVSVEQVLLSLLTGSSAVPSCCSSHGPGREGGDPS